MSSDSNVITSSFACSHSCPHPLPADSRNKAAFAINLLVFPLKFYYYFNKAGRGQVGCEDDEKTGRSREGDYSPGQKKSLFLRKVMSAEITAAASRVFVLQPPFFPIPDSPPSLPILIPWTFFPEKFLDL